MKTSFLLWLCLSSTALPQSSQPGPIAKVPAVKTTVVVLGSPEAITAAESAHSTVTLDPQEHPLALPSLQDYLRIDASTFIQQRGSAGTQADISIRGTSFEQTLVLLNGLRINDAQTSHFNLDIPVPLEAIGSIDILHGSGSTLYGSDAIGGVVNFETFKPEASTVRLRSGFGSFGTNQQSFLASLVHHRASEVLSGTREHSDGFIADRDYLSESVSSETRLTTPLGDTDILLAGSNRPFGADQFYGPYNSFEHTKGWFASLRQPFGQSTYAAVAYRRHSDIFVLFRNNPAYYKNQHIDESWQAALRRHQTLFRKLTASYGLEENTDAIQSNTLGRHSRNRTAGYLNLDLRVAQRGTLSFGLREEILSGGRRVFSPQFAGSLWLPHNVKLRGSVGYGFRLPTYTDLYYSAPNYIPNPNLKPESAWTYDAGADWYLNPHTAASVTVFHSRQSDAIAYVRTGPSVPYRASNLIGLHFTGVESSLEWRPSSHQHLRADWTLLFGAQQALSGLQSDTVSNYPTNNAGLQWAQTWHQVLISSRLGFTQRYQRDAYPVWTGTLAREAGRVHPYLQFSNLSNTGYQEISGVPMPGRSITGGVELLFSRGKR
ncbi:TonB-dependent receptor plug domain-containing protein [soil metagenome]